MNTLFKVVKHKTDIKGFWKDDKGKIYIDNIKTIPIKSEGQFQYESDILFKLGELAIFYILGDNAFVKDKEGNTQRLKERIILKPEKLSKEYVKGLINEYSGLTIYRKDTGFRIEIWR